MSKQLNGTSNGNTRNRTRAYLTKTAYITPDRRQLSSMHRGFRLCVSTDVMSDAEEDRRGEERSEEGRGEEKRGELKRKDIGRTGGERREE